MKHHDHSRTYKDPVCGMEISHKTATEVLEYEDRTYYFCAAVCRNEFEADPEKYIQHHRQHGLAPG